VLQSRENLVLAVSTPLLNKDRQKCLVNVQVISGNAFEGRWAVVIDVPTGLSGLQIAYFEVDWLEPFTLFPDKRSDSLNSIPSFNAMTMTRSHFQSGFGYIRWFKYIRSRL
jgi:hypothetical protein